MAELILTEEERRSLTLLEWDDASIGRAVKKVALIIGDEKGERAIELTTGIAMLIAKAVNANANETTLTAEGLSIGDELLGDWKVVVTKIGGE